MKSQISRSKPTSGPIAIVPIDIDRMPGEVSLPESYGRALLLWRMHGRPVGQSLARVSHGRLSTRALEEALPLDLLPATAWLELSPERAPAVAPTQTLPTSTVAVCTRNRTDDLCRCLKALAELPNLGQEYLVVDSASDGDGTTRLVQRYPGFRYFREERPGLNIARNRALREAHGEIVAFTDDDAVPEPGWLSALLQNFKDPLVFGVTGLTLPAELETEAQQLFERYTPFGRGFRRRVFSTPNVDPPAGGIAGAGVNMALRRCVLDQVGPFDEALDAGTLTRSGGDNHMFSRILAAGFRLVYEPSAVSWHRHRRTRTELRQAWYGYGAGIYASWTRDLLVDRECSVLPLLLRWLRNEQMPRLLSSLLKRSGTVPADLAWAELGGCVAGPWLYWQSARKHRRNVA